MPLNASTAINMKRNRVVKYINGGGKSQNAIIRAVTGSTLTLFLPHEHRVVTTAPAATTHKGPGWHHRI